MRERLSGCDGNGMARAPHPAQSVMTMLPPALSAFCRLVCVAAVSADGGPPLTVKMKVSGLQPCGGGGLGGGGSGGDGGGGSGGDGGGGDGGLSGGGDGGLGSGGDGGLGGGEGRSAGGGGEAGDGG